jgi:SPOR domain
VKWLVGVLLLLNIVVFMWGSWYKPVPPGAAVKARPPVNADKIQPLRQPTPASVSGADGTGQGGRLCISLGPFASAEQVSAALATAQRLGVSTAHSEQREETTTSYRVYLPSLPSRKLAERKRTQLTELGFKEHYIIDEPGRENAVSLGVFAVEKNAAVLVRTLAEKGVSAKQEAVTNAQTTYWLKAEIDPPQLGGLRQQGWPDARARVSRQACPQDSATAGRGPRTEGSKP